jgi:hypothetical protein
MHTHIHTYTHTHTLTHSHTPEAGDDLLVGVTEEVDELVRHS